MAGFWNSVLQIEGLWNSPLRVEVLRILATTIFFVLGIVAGRLWGMWRRYRQLKMAERGESQDVVTIEKIILDRRPDGTEVLRIRSCGRDPMETVFPNPAARDEFQARAGKTTDAQASGVDGWKNGLVSASRAGDLGLRTTAGRQLPA